MFRRSRNHTIPALNTAALPDLVFTVLFFFMIVTHMRHVQPQVSHTPPQGRQLQKTPHKPYICYIYIGHLQGHADGDYHVQLGNRLATPDEIGPFIDEQRAAMQPADAAMLTVSLVADRQTPMSLIGRVKRELRKAGVKRINYSATIEKE